MFFYANKEIAIDETEFWEKSYLLRSTQCQKLDVAYAPDILPLTLGKKGVAKGKERTERDLEVCPLFIKDIAKAVISAGKSLQLIQHVPTTFAAISSSNQETGKSIAQLTLSEVFCVSLAALVGHGDHISENFGQEKGIASSFQSFVGKHKLEENENSEKIWCKFLVDTLHSERESDLKPTHKSTASGGVDGLPISGPFCPENPAITVCRRFLHENRDGWNELNLSRNFYLPPLNDEGLRKAIFGGNNETFMAPEGTNYTFGFQFGEYLRSQEDRKMLEGLFPFPTLLPSFQVLVYQSSHSSSLAGLYSNRE